MNLLITGGLGFIGSHLTRHFLDKGHRVTVTGLRESQNLFFHDRFTYISADTSRKGSWQEALEDVDVVVNLAGKTIFKRWTRRYKQRILDSRVLTTRNLVEALPADRPVVLCNASATGFYGDGGDAILTETSPGGADFLAEVGRAWENEALRAEAKGVRVAIARFGIVLGSGGGIIGKMVPAFRFFAGGPLGDGRQWFPWIHLEDLAAAVDFVIENNKIHGPINFCSPRPVTNGEFVKTLGRVLSRPAWLPAPAFMLRLAMGELGAAILSSQRVVPEKLTSNGFRFRFPDIEAALADIVGRPRER